MNLAFFVCAAHMLGFTIAHPINGNPAQNQRNCIRMTPQKEKELDVIVKKLAEFINTLHDEHEEFDITLLKIDIEQHIEDDEKEKETILQLTVNDCAETDGIHQDSAENDNRSKEAFKKDSRDAHSVENTLNILETKSISTEGDKEKSKNTESSRIKHNKIRNVDQDSLKNEIDSLKDENKNILKIEDLKAENEKSKTEIIAIEYLNKEPKTTGIEDNNELLGSSDASIRKNVGYQTINVNPKNLRSTEDYNIVKTDKEVSAADRDEDFKENKEPIEKNLVKVRHSVNQKDEVNESHGISKENEISKSEENDEVEKAKGTTVKDYDTSNDKVVERKLRNECFNTLDDEAKNREGVLGGKSLKEDMIEEYKELQTRSVDSTQAVEEDLYGNVVSKEGSTSEVSVLPEIMILELQDNGNKLLQELRRRRRKVTPFLVFVQHVKGKDEYVFL